MSKRFVVADNRELVELSAPGTGNLTTRGKFKPVRRVLELTDAQVALFSKAIDAALKAGVLLEDRRAV
jgi:hypothetical protein